MATAPPQKIDKRVRSFCKEICGGLPVYLPVQVDPSAAPNCCFQNVKEKVEREGGEIVVGWAIWEWKYVILEGEHHAIWRTTLGNLVDITPKPIPLTEILFLQDATATYDFSNFNPQRDNIRRAIRDTPEILRLIKLREDLFRLIKDTPSNQPIDFSQPRVLELGSKIDELTQLINNSIPSRNSRCYCGSGKKFKRCCGQ
jgi:hypothetical protein